jgi:signal transduction histidine kinase
MVTVADAIAGGKLDNPIDARGRDEVAKLALSVEKMQAALRGARDQDQAQSWVQTGIARLNDAMRGDLDAGSLASKIIGEITTYLDAKIGAFYLLRDSGGEPTLALLGSYAYTKRKNLSSSFKTGEGLVGQAALERQQILLRNVPEDYIRVTSGLGEAVPRFICVTPFLYEDQVKGVLEVGTLDELTDVQLEYVKHVMPAVAVTLETAQGREELARALERAQQLAEELQAQQEELKASNEQLQVQQEELKAANEELEEQTQALQRSEEKLKAQQEEMEVVNEELEEKNELLERQKREVEQARREIADKAEDLALASKYKSEFLANMSHELRTPLNAVIGFSEVLAERMFGEVNEKQAEYLQDILSSGRHLLSLINDILDLSKVEAGRLELELGRFHLPNALENALTLVRARASRHGIALEVSVDEALGEIVGDERKIQQILLNLLSNAVKFTPEGGRVGVTATAADGVITISVSDTGVGIAPEDQEAIFEEFRQVGRDDARKQEGTGLGLTLPKKFVELHGGRIWVRSQVGQGSTFTFTLPVRPQGRSSSDQGGGAPTLDS